MFGQGDEVPEDSNTVSVRSLFARRRDRYGSRRRPVDELLSNHEGEVDTVGWFKMTTPYFARTFDNRPVHICCSSCFPDNRKKVPNTFSSLPVRNCLNVELANKQHNWYIRYFANLAHFLSKKELASRYRLVSPEQVIAQSPDTFSKIVANDDGQNPCRTEEKKANALTFLKSFSVNPVTEAQLSRRIRIGGWLASKIFSSVFDGICVHDGQIALLKSIQKHHPVVYVPLQRSHWDHFILSMILIDCDMMTPLLITRKSLMQDCFLGMLAKWALGLGCRQGRTKKDKKSQIVSSHRHSSVAQAAYLTALLKEGMSLEFSVEKHRSRTGKPGTVLIGTEFINLILQLIATGQIEDAIIVPVSVNYEKFPQQDFINNYNPPVKSGLCRQLWRVLSTLVKCLIGVKNQRLGFARVDFAHPISVREFREAVMTPNRVDAVLDLFNKNKYFWMTDGYCNPLSNKYLNWDDDVGSVASLSSAYGDTDSMVPVTNEDIVIADTLASHTIYDALRASPFMSTHLLSFLLLTRYRQGATMERLVHDLNDLMILFRERKNDVGFYKQSELNCVIERAADLLGSDLISSIQSGTSVLIKPNLNRLSLLQLGYYSNHVTPFLAMDGIIATALFALKGPKLKLYRGTSLEIHVKETELIATTAQLIKLLKAEFLFHPPCLQLEEAVKLAIDKMRDEYLLLPEMNMSTRRDYDDDDTRLGGGDYGDIPPCDQRILVKAVQDPTSFRKLSQVRNIIIPYIQVYVEAFLVLYEMLPTNDMDAGTENSNRKQNCTIPELTLRNKMLQKVLQVSSIPQEVVVMDTITNFLVSMKECGLISELEDEESGEIMLALVAEYATRDYLNIARNNMLSFLSF